MRFKYPLIFLIICFIGAVMSNVAINNIQKKPQQIKRVIEPRSKPIVSLICNGENDQTPLLKRKYKAKGLKESISLDTPDFEQFFSYTSNLWVETTERFRNTSTTYNFKRGPPPA